MSKRVICIIIVSLLAFSANAFALDSFDFTSVKLLDGSKKSGWNQTILFDASVKGTPFTLNSFTWTMLLGGFAKNADVSFTAKFDGISLLFSGHTNASGILLSTLSVKDSILLGNLASAFSDGKVHIAFDNKYRTYFSGGAGSAQGAGPVAPEPATILLIGAGLAGLPIARHLKKKNKDS
jgi:hypothetical protein